MINQADKIISKTMLMLLLLLCTLLSTTLSENCGDNCPSGTCNNCPCGLTKNIVSLDEYCSLSSVWDKNCCKCIAGK